MPESAETAVDPESGERLEKILNWGDMVRCERMSPADLPIVVEVVRTQGHRTLRIYFEEIKDADREWILDEIVRRGATYENANDTMHALDLEPNVNSEKLLDYLAREEEAGHLAWETGWS